MTAGLLAFGGFCAFAVIAATVMGNLKRRWDRERRIGRPAE